MMITSNIYSSERDDSDVVVPPFLDLTLFFTQTQYQPVMYELTVGVSHFRSLVGGHYLGYGMRAGEWLYRRVNK
jgi:ubiquitin C-terminal hydrolase